MPQTVSNSGERRASMLQFGGVFILTVALACFVFLRSCGLYQELPCQECEALRDKESITKALGELNDHLLAFEKAQRTNSASIPTYREIVERKSGAIHGMLAGKDTTIAYKDVNKALRTADNYFVLIKTLGNTEGPLQTRLQLLESEKATLLLNFGTCKTDKESAERDVRDLRKDVSRLESDLKRCCK